MFCFKLKLMWRVSPIGDYLSKPFSSSLSPSSLSLFTGVLSSCDLSRRYPADRLMTRLVIARLGCGLSLGLAAAISTSCAVLADDATMELCAPGADWSQANRLSASRFVSQCILRNNATILRAKQDFFDYSQRLDQLSSNEELKRHYAAIRARLLARPGAEARQRELAKLGSLNSWLARQDGLDQHSWHGYSPAIRRVVSEQP